MKKFFVTLILVLVVVTAAFAGINDWGIWDMTSLEIAPQVPLYREVMADPYGFTTEFEIVKNLSASTNPLNKVYSIVVDYTNSTNPTAEYEELEFRSQTAMSGNNTYSYLKTGTTVSLFRLTFDGYKMVPKTEIEFTAGGYIDAMFENFEHNTGLGYDGSYLVAGNVRFADVVTFRGGIKHMSGHYSDEVIEELYKYQKINGINTKQATYTEYIIKTAENVGLQINDSNKYFNGVVEYVRDNSLIGGVSVDLPNGFRVYAEAELPKAKSWFRPVAHVPALENHWSKEFGNTLIDRMGSSASDAEGLPQGTLTTENEKKEGTSYRGWRIHTGAEYRYNLKHVSVIASGDIQFHQDGQTLHQLGSYASTNPWEMEYTIGLGIELANALVAGKTFKLECKYHDGRAPLAQLFFEKMNYFSFGISIQ